MVVMNVAGLEVPLRSAGFRGTVEHDAAARIVYGTDNSVYQLRPVGVAVPTSIDDLAAIARVNHEMDTPFDLVARDEAFSMSRFPAFVSRCSLGETNSHIFRGPQGTYRRTD